MTIGTVSLGIMVQPVLLTLCTEFQIGLHGLSGFLVLIPTKDTNIKEERCAAEHC
jgi:hypothetical protein